MPLIRELELGEESEASVWAGKLHCPSPSVGEREHGGCRGAAEDRRSGEELSAWKGSAPAERDGRPGSLGERGGQTRAASLCLPGRNRGSHT